MAQEIRLSYTFICGLILGVLITAFSVHTAKVYQENVASKYELQQYEAK